MVGPDSRELLHQYRNGRSEAAREIFDRYVERLIALARGRISPKLRRRFDPEDVVQSAYRSFFARADRDEYVLERAGDLWRLLASITMHKVHQQVERNTAARRDFRREELNESNAEAWTGNIAPEPTPDEVVALIEELAAICERLDPKERTVLTKRLQGQSIEEIATTIGRSHRTVRRLLQQAKCRLEEMLASF